MKKLETWQWGALLIAAFVIIKAFPGMMFAISDMVKQPSFIYKHYTYGESSLGDGLNTSDSFKVGDLVFRSFDENVSESVFEIGGVNRTMLSGDEVGVNDFLSVKYVPSEWRGLVVARYDFFVDPAGLKIVGVSDKVWFVRSDKSEKVVVTVDNEVANGLDCNLYVKVTRASLTQQDVFMTDKVKCVKGENKLFFDLDVSGFGDVSVSVQPVFYFDSYSNLTVPDAFWIGDWVHCPKYKSCVPVVGQEAYFLSSTVSRDFKVVSGDVYEQSSDQVKFLNFTERLDVKRGTSYAWPVYVIVGLLLLGIGYFLYFLIKKK